MDSVVFGIIIEVQGRKRNKIMIYIVFLYLFTVFD